MIEFTEGQKKTIASGLTLLSLAVVVAFVVLVGWLALKGELSKGTVAIVREEAKKYKVAFAPVPIANAAKYTRSVPKEYIAKNGHDVTEAFLEYARPIVGELPPCEVL